MDPQDKRHDPDEPRPSQPEGAPGDGAGGDIGRDRAGRGHAARRDDDRPRTSAARRWTGRIVGVVATIVLAASVLAFFGTASWWLDVLNEARMQYLWIALLCALVLLVARAWAWLAVALVPVAINAVLVVPWFFESRPEAPEDAGRDLRLMVLNVRVTNEGFSPVLDLIRLQEPDILVLNEVDPAWLAQIRDLAQGYTVYDTPSQGRFGVLLLTKHPIDSVSIEQFTDRWSPSIVARLKVDGRPAVLIATHPPAPLSATTWENRNEHLAELARYVRAQDVPVLVAGDLNITMWSPHFDALLEASGLSETRKGFGVNPTFPAYMPGLLRVPLDHVLASEHWSVFDCSTGPNVGSDHLPLTVDVTLREVE